MNPNKSFAVLTTALALTAILTSTTQAEQEFSTVMPVESKLRVAIDSAGCQNATGPIVTLGGELRLGQVLAKFIFQNNARGTHRATAITETGVVLLPLGEAIVLPKQPVLGGVGGNPRIYVQFHDGHGNDLSDLIYLGRCVQGLKLSQDVSMAALAALKMDFSGCNNSPGPVITINGEILLSGLHARFIFRNNRRGTHQAAVIRDITLVHEGQAITIPKQPVLGGAGGNPIIGIQFLKSEDEPLGDPIRLGRCNQL